MRPIGRIVMPGPRCGGPWSTLVTVLVRAAIFGSIRGAMVGLTVGMRGWMLRLGRMIACADACGMSSQTSGAAAAISAIAAQPAFIRLLIPSAIMRPRHCANRHPRTRNLRRGFREADDFLAAQLAHQARDFVPAHRLAAELQAEQAVGAADDGCLIIVEQRVDVGHLG